MNIVLWIIQILLACLFLFAGATKLVLPIEKLMGPGMALPGLLIRFIGICEVLGGLGLVLPGLLRIKTFLTPLAATALVIIMIGAVIITFAGGQIGPAVFSLIVGLLLAFVAYGRWSKVPLRSR